MMKVAKTGCRQSIETRSFDEVTLYQENKTEDQSTVECSNLLPSLRKLPPLTAEEVASIVDMDEPPPLRKLPLTSRESRKRSRNASSPQTKIEDIPDDDPSGPSEKLAGKAELREEEEIVLDDEILQRFQNMMTSTSNDLKLLEKVGVQMDKTKGPSKYIKAAKEGNRLVDKKKKETRPFEVQYQDMIKRFEILKYSNTQFEYWYNKQEPVVPAALIQNGMRFRVAEGEVYSKIHRQVALDLMMHKENKVNIKSQLKIEDIRWSGDSSYPRLYKFGDTVPFGKVLAIDDEWYFRFEEFEDHTKRTMLIDEECTPLIAAFLLGKFQVFDLAVKTKKDKFSHNPYDLVEEMHKDFTIMSNMDMAPLMMFINRWIISNSTIEKETAHHLTQALKAYATIGRAEDQDVTDVMAQGLAMIVESFSSVLGDLVGQTTCKAMRNVKEFFFAKDENAVFAALRMTFKTLWRMYRGYKDSDVMLELFLDSDCATVAATILASISRLWAEAGVLAHNEDSSGMGVIFTTLFYLSGSIFAYDPDKLGGFVRMIPTVARILPDDFTEMAGKIPIVGKIFGQSLENTLQGRFPKAFAYLGLKNTMLAAEKPTQHMGRGVLRAFKDFLHERSHWTEQDQKAMFPYQRELILPETVLRSYPGGRIQPTAVILKGLPGCGKTRGSKYLSSASVIGLAMFNLIEKPKILTDEIYTIPRDSTFWSNYMNQAVLLMNDFYTLRDIAGVASEISTFMFTVDEGVAMAPGAAITEKGKYIDPYLVIITCNMGVEEIVNLCKLNNKTALRRRFTFEFQVIPRCPDSEGKWTMAEGYAPEDQCLYFPCGKGWTALEKTKGLTFKQVYNLIMEDIKARIIEREEDTFDAEKFVDMASTEKAKHDKIQQDNKEKVGEAKFFPVKDESKVGHDEAYDGKEEKEEFRPDCDCQFANCHHAKADREVGIDCYSEAERELLRTQIKPDVDLLTSNEFDIEQATMRQVIFLKSCLHTNMREGPKMTFGSDKRIDFLGANVDKVSTMADVRRFETSEKLSLNGGFNHSVKLREGVTALTAVRKLHYYALARWFYDVPYEGEEIERLLNLRYQECQALITVTDVASQSMKKVAGVYEKTTGFIQTQYENVYTYLTEKVGQVKNLLSGRIEENRTMISVLLGSLLFVLAARSLTSSFKENRLKNIEEAEEIRLKKFRNKFSGQVVQEIAPKWKAEHHGDVQALNFRDIKAPKGYIEKIRDSIVEVRLHEDDEKPICFGFCITTVEMLLPWHVIQQMKDRIVVKTVNGQTSIRLRATKQGTGFIAAGSPTNDLGYILFGGNGLTGISGTHWSKIHSGPVQEGLAFRVEQKGFSGSFAYQSEHAVNHVTHDKKCHPANIPGARGLCGIPYVSCDSSNDQRILGIHVSGSNDNDTSFFTNLGRERLQQMSDAMKKRWPVVGAYTQGETFVDQDHLDFRYEARSPFVVHQPNKSDKVPNEHVILGLARRGHVLQYAPAKLRKDANGLKPDMVAISKIMKKNQHRKDSPQAPFSDEVYKKAWAHVPKNDPEDSRVPTWEEVLDSDEYQKKVDGSKSAGLGCGKKREFFEWDEDLDEMRVQSDLVFRMEEEIKIFARGGTIPVKWTVGSLKSELRLFEKVEACKTRMFTPINIDSYLIARRYWKPMYIWLAKHGGSCGIHYAKTPNESARMRSPKWGKKAAGFDVEGQDCSHYLSSYDTFFKFALDKFFTNEDDDNMEEVGVFGYLNTINRIRYAILKQSMHILVALGGGLMRSEGFMCSGSYFTTGFNCCMQFIISLLIEGDISVDLFGDDFIVTGETEALVAELIYQVKELWRLHGYNLTSQVKNSPIRVEDHEDITLCGRYLANLDGKPVCPLEADRLVKSVCFVKLNNPSSYSNTVLSCIVELGYHPEKFSKNFLKGMINSEGKHLGKFLPKNWRAVAHIPGSLLGYVNTWVTCASKREFNSNTAYVARDESDNSTASSDNSSLLQGDVQTIESTETEVDLGDIPYVVNPEGVIYPKLEREVFVGAYSLAEGSSPDVTLIDEAFPSALLIANKQLANAMQTTSYLVFDAIELTLTFSASSMQSGGLMVGAAAMSRTPANTNQMSSGPHQIIDICGGGTLVTTVPFIRDVLITKANLINIAEEHALFDYFRYRCMVITFPTTASQGAMSFLLKARFINPRVVESGSLDITFTNNEVVPTWKGNAHHQSAEEKMAVSGPSSTSSYPTEGGTAFSSVGRFALKTADTVGKVGAVVGMGKTLNPAVTRVTRGGNFYAMANVSGVDLSDKLGSDPTGQGIGPPLSTGDDMSFDKICGHPSKVGDVLWVPADAAGKILWYGRCGPFPTIQYDNFTRFAKMSNLFLKWRADIKFTVRTFSSVFERGEYVIAVDYSNKDPAEMTYDKIMNLTKVRINLALTKEQSVVIPFVDNVPMRWNRYKYDIGDALNLHDPVIYLVALTKLTTNDNTAQQVFFYIEMSAQNVVFACPDFVNTAPPEPFIDKGKFLPVKNFIISNKGKEEEEEESKKPSFPPKPYNELANPPRAIPLNALVYRGPPRTKGDFFDRESSVAHDQALGIDDDDGTVGGTVTLGPPVKGCNVEEFSVRYTGQEAMTSLRSYLKRFRYADELGTDFTEFPFFNIVNVKVDEHIEDMYVFGFGSKRYKIYSILGSTNVPLITSYTLVDGGTTVPYNPATVRVPEGIPYAEIEIPYPGTTPFFVLGQPMAKPRVIITKPDSVTTFKVAFTARGDDWQYFGFNYSQVPAYRQTSVGYSITDQPATLPS